MNEKKSTSTFLPLNTFKNKLRATIIFLITSFLLVSSPPVYGLSIEAPSVFKLQTSNVVIFDGLKVEKVSVGPKFKLGPINGGRFFEIYDNGATDSLSLVDVSQRAHAPTTLKLSTTSTKIRLCLYHFSQQRCGQNVEGTRDFAGNSFSIHLSDTTSQAEKVFIDVIQKRITEDEASQRLEQLRLSEYKDYLTFLRTTPPRDIEKYSISGEIDGRRFIIEGALTYDPNYTTLYPEEVAKTIKRWQETNKAFSITFLVMKITGGAILLFLGFVIFRRIVKKKV